MRPPPSRRAALRLGLGLGAAPLLARMAWAAAPELAGALGRAASAWVAGLSDDQRGEARLAWDSDWRENWHYTPRRRPGLVLRAMSAAQTAAAFDLLAALLSERGLAQVGGAIELERVLGELTGRPGYRDPGNYALVLFGDPAGAAPWGFRFEGHHLSLTAVVLPQAGVACTPAFVGANPAEVPRSHGHAGFRLLGAEEDAAFSLVRSLDAGLRDRVLIGDRSLGDIVSGPGRETALRELQGVPLAELGEARRDGVMRILQLYAGLMRPELADAVLDRVREAGIDRLHFAWAGALEPGRPHYFRVHGPTVLVEYDNTQNGANHIHSVWIDPTDVFGRDSLRDHHRRAH